MELQNDFLKKTGYLYSKKTDKAWSGLLNKIEQEEIPDLKPSFFSSWTVRIAAIMVILLGLAWGIQQLINVKVRKVETASFQRQLILPDGSIAYLNGNSSLTYPKSFGTKNRRVTLIGEAFFKVTKNPIKPFIVETRSARIRVLGTSFNVLAPFDHDRVEVLVKTGIVSLASIHNRKDRVFLKKGEFGMMEAGKAEKAQAPGKNYLSWQTKKFQFKNAELKNVVETLSHAYTTHILLDSDSIGQLRLTSTYNQVSLKTIIQSLCLTFHLKSTQNNDKIVLSAVN